MNNSHTSNVRCEELTTLKIELDALSARLCKLYENGCALSSPEMLDLADMHGGLAAKYMRLQMGTTHAYPSSCSLKC